MFEVLQKWSWRWRLRSRPGCIPYFFFSPSQNSKTAVFKRFYWKAKKIEEKIWCKNGALGVHWWFFVCSKSKTISLVCLQKWTVLQHIILYHMTLKSNVLNPICRAIGWHCFALYRKVLELFCWGWIAV